MPFKRYPWGFAEINDLDNFVSFPLKVITISFVLVLSRRTVLYSENGIYFSYRWSEKKLDNWRILMPQISYRALVTVGVSQSYIPCPRFRTIVLTTVFRLSCWCPSITLTQTSSNSAPITNFASIEQENDKQTLRLLFYHNLLCFLLYNIMIFIY